MVVIALIPACATVVNPRTKVNGQPIWNYRRAIVYKFVEGCTLGFCCGCLEKLRLRMIKFVEEGKLWEEKNTAQVAD